MADRHRTGATIGIVVALAITISCSGDPARYSPSAAVSSTLTPSPSVTACPSTRGYRSSWADRPTSRRCGAGSSCRRRTTCTSRTPTGRASSRSRIGEVLEFDPAWAPDGSLIVYRDSRRGINHDDEIYIVNANGASARNLTRDPGNDWGLTGLPTVRRSCSTPTATGSRWAGSWSNRTVPISGIRTDAYVEYPSWSPEGDRIAFMGGDGPGEYDIWTIAVDGGTSGSSPTPWVPTVARLVAGRHPHRVHLGPRRLLLLRRTGLPHHGRYRTAPRRVGRERRRDRAHEGDDGVRPVRHVVSRRTVPARVRVRPVRDPPGRHRPSVGSIPGPVMACSPTGSRSQTLWHLFPSSGPACGTTETCRPDRGRAPLIMASVGMILLPRQAARLWSSCRRCRSPR